ncbi:MobV family relaxase [Viridibacillus arvi]|uniref:MobV family relaxase n=1 Tax=Viridibacillus arvi TaxID=263475 RepID=UPI0006A9B6B4|nr:MobV family relaxase [Viridibacillus arvi]
MSYAVVRMAKMKSHDLKGIQFHNQRERESRSNPDIDKEKTKDNYDLINAENINYNERVKEIIESQKTGARKTRKDAVLVNELIVTSDKGFFERLTAAEEKAFFEESANFFSERYGLQNVAYATVHKDENTPHMHLGVVPMRDGKLQGKNVFNRQELLWLQDEFPKHMQKKGFELQRGEEGSKAEHLDSMRYKIEQTKKQLDGLEQLQEEGQLLEEKIQKKKKEFTEISEQLPVKKKSLKGLKKEIETEVKPKLLGKPEIVKNETGNYVITPEQLEKVEGLINAAVFVKKDYERLQDTDLVKQNDQFRDLIGELSEQNKDLKKENNILRNDLKLVIGDINTLEARISDLKAEIKLVYQSAKEFVKERTQGAMAFKDVFKGLIDKVKQKAPGGEFEKAHRRETARELNKDFER